MCKIFIELAKHPSSTVKILRARKSLFRALKTVSKEIYDELTVAVVKTGNILKDKYNFECASNSNCSRNDEWNTISDERFDIRKFLK